MDHRTSLFSITVGTFAYIPLHTPVQSSPIESQSDSLISSANTLVALFQTSVVMVRKILLQRLWDHQAHRTIAIF